MMASEKNRALSLTIRFFISIFANGIPAFGGTNMEKYRITNNYNKRMEKLIINNYEEFASHEGQILGTSDFIELTQERINLFADATLDHQWIHVDTERAKTESQFGTTIAHGYLTLSVLPYLWNQIVDVRNVKMLVNYGIDKMKFGQPVLSGQSISLTTKLQSIQNLRGAVKTEVKFTMNVKETGKKAIEGIAIFIYYFEN